MARKHDKEGMRQRLLEAAQTVFSSKSPMEITMLDVSNEAGLGKGTIYLYFRSRDELMIEMFRDCIAQGRGELLSFLESRRGNISEPQLLEEVLEFVLKEVSGHVRLWGLWYQFLALATSPKYRESVLEIVRQHRERRDELVVGIIEEGKRSGTFRPDLCSRLTVATLFALIDGFISLAYIEAIPDWMTTCRQAMAPILAGLRPASASGGAAPV